MTMVYFIGAGTGQLDYLTVRGQQLLSQAEVLIYDALVDDSLLAQTPATCEQIFVGKRGGQPSPSQSEIDQLLVEQAKTGKCVVRLKSGDPFIFGRTTSEIQALIDANCAFEVVPGISSALAAPLFAGIPLTDPVMSRSFTVLTGHDPDILDWETLSQMETLVILMGTRTLESIIHQLFRHGRSDHTPIAIIRQGGRPEQQAWIGTLGTILKQTAGVSLSPSVIVIGEVVRLSEYLKPPQSAKPLINQTILVTRAAGQSSQFTDLLTQQGAQVLEMPALVITPPSSWESLDQAIAQLSTFDWLILTSSNGVDAFFERLTVAGLDVRALAGVKIAVVGKKTAGSLREYRLNPDFVPPNFVADDLVSHFPEPVADKKILFPRVETGGRDVLVQELTSKGGIVTEVPAYESGCPQTIPPHVLTALEQHQINTITFASSKTVKNFAHLVKTHLSEPFESLFRHVCIASIGPQTSQTCRTLFGRVDVEATEYTLEGLTTALITHQKHSISFTIHHGS